MIRMHTCLFLSLWWAPGAWIYAEKKRKKKKRKKRKRKKKEKKKKWGKDDENKTEKNPVWAKQQKPNEQHQQQKIHLK